MSVFVLLQSCGPDATRGNNVKCDTTWKGYFAELALQRQEIDSVRGENTKVGTLIALWA